MNPRDFSITHRWPLVVALATVLVRLIYLLELSSQPGFDIPIVDEKWHWEWARSILTTSFWGDGAYFRAPLYPYFLAFLHAITGGAVLGAKILQTLLAGGTAFMLFRLGDHLFGRTAAWISGLAYAFYGTLVFYETMFLIPVLFLFLTVWAMYRIVVHRDSGSMQTWLITGLLFGLAAVARPNILIVMPVLMIWLYAITKDAAFVARARRPVLLLLGCLIAIAPVTIRNVAVTGEFMVISSQGGINLYLGNNEKADGLTMLMPEVDLDESVSWREFGGVVKEAAEEEAGRQLSEAEQSSFWTAKAIDFIIANPGKFVELVFMKTTYLVSGFENSDNTDLYHQRQNSILFAGLVWEKLLFFPFGLLLPLALGGVILLNQQRRQLLPIYLFILAYIPSIVLFLVTARHRLPLVPFLILLAAGGVALLIELMKSGGWKQVVPAALVIVLSLVGFNRTYFDLDYGSDFQVHFNHGIRLERLGDLEGALAEYHKADRVYPMSVPLINNLGLIQMKLERNAEAERSFRRAMAIDPSHARTHNNLGLIVYQKGQVEEAMELFLRSRQLYGPETRKTDELAQVYVNLAECWDQVGQVDSAKFAFDTALRLAPLEPDFVAQSAAFHARRDYGEIADSLFGRANHLKGGLDATDYFNWGLSHLRREMLAEGVVFMHKAIDKSPDMHQAWYCLASAYYQGGHPVDSSFFYLDECLRLKPDYAPALRFRERLLNEQ